VLPGGLGGRRLDLEMNLQHIWPKNSLGPPPADSRRLACEKDGESVALKREPPCLVASKN
jgi:hypothetical protein